MEMTIDLIQNVAITVLAIIVMWQAKDIVKYHEFIVELYDNCKKLAEFSNLLSERVRDIEGVENGE